MVNVAGGGLGSPRDVAHAGGAISPVREEIERRLENLAPAALGTFFLNHDSCLAAPRSARASRWRARSSSFTTLPYGVRGSLSTNSNDFGTLNLESTPSRYDDSSAASTGLPGARTTNATLTSPRCRRDAHHGRIGHTGVCRESRFDLRGVDVDAAADDHVLLASRDVVEAVGVLPGEIPGVKPPIRVERLRRGLGIVPVAAAHVRALQPELANVADRNILAAFVRQSRPREHQGFADGSCPGHRLVDAHREAVDPHLRQPIALLEGHARA